MKKDNIFWGVLLLLAAAYILAHSLDLRRISV